MTDCWAYLRALRSGLMASQLARRPRGTVVGDFTRSDVDEILHLIDQSNFDELKLELGGMKLELRRHGAAPPVAQPPVPPNSPKATAPIETGAATAMATTAAGGAAVPAPLLGTFWHAPRPGAAPFVAVGDEVHAETIIGIIEVMKLMTSVPAGFAGTVLGIEAPNGELVEFGQPLIRIQPI